MENNSIFNKTSGSCPSLWLEEEAYPTPVLTENIDTDICIIGAGIAGLSIAYHLLQAGKKVVVLEAKQIGSGESGRTTAHLSTALDTGYGLIASLHGKKIARLVADSHCQALLSIEKIVQDEKIDCDFKRVAGYIFSANDDDEAMFTAEEKAAVACGLDATILESPQITGFMKRPVLKFADQAQYHPMKYLNGLAKAIIQKKGIIFTQTPVLELQPGKVVRFKTAAGNVVTAKNVVIATNAPIFDNTFSFAKQASYRSYVIAGLIPKDSLEHALFWDTASPYHYVRTQPYNAEEDMVIIGGEDHRTGESIAQDYDPFKKLAEWYEQNFSPLKKIMYTWSGQVQEPSDYLPYIGRLHDKNNLFIITGHSGNGMTYGALAGILIKDLILDKDNPWEEAYEPTREAFKNLSNLIRHNFITLINYLRLLIPSWTSESTIGPGEAGIVCNAWMKTAVYHDEQGKVCKTSLRCTHMNAPLRWNPIEKTWDCPAHGSRFSACGAVLQGPATKPLKVKK